MDDDAVVTVLGARFDADEERLRGVALRVLGAGAEREAAAVLARVRAGLDADAPAVARLWLTALVARACLTGAGAGAGGGPGHARVAAEKAEKEEKGEKAGRGEPAVPAPAPVPTAVPAPAPTAVPAPVPVPEGLEEAVLLGFLAVLDRLGARERLAYLLHDVFGLPAGETARIMGGSAAEAARWARRARTRLRGGGAGGSGGAETGGDGSRDEGRGGGTGGEGDGPERHALVDAFRAAARARDAAALAALLDPEAVAYAERGPVHGAPAVAAAAAAFARPGALVRPALVEGAVGLVTFLAGRPVAAVAFGFRRGRIVSLDITTGEEHVRALDLAFPE
ncbi:sigma factor-like helix-turn-helix DNA-binding protein [Streptomyces sp. NPDC035033]|uniref:sigma factor-like helix-turn-helix DNA-binding protein n=1 Tax=Streptomyces sp. NPDC035033 TaxID=3155368 RepID=UPI0033E2F750